MFVENQLNNGLVLRFFEYLGFEKYSIDGVGRVDPDILEPNNFCQFMETEYSENITIGAYLANDDRYRGFASREEFLKKLIYFCENPPSHLSTSVVKQRLLEILGEIDWD